MALHDNASIIKFADDTTFIGTIASGVETEYKGEGADRGGPGVMTTVFP